MNINLKLKLKLVNQQTETKIVNTSATMLLNPYYASEDEIISVFSDLTDEKLLLTRKLIFSNSILALNLTRTIEKLAILPVVELFALRRDLTICLTTNDLAKHLNKDLINSTQRSKSLGDFAVSTSTRGDNTVLKEVLANSSNCVLELKGLILDIESERVLPKAFTKGILNPNSKTSSRLWWLEDLSIKISDSYATNKYMWNGEKYKAASFNTRFLNRQGDN